jgi:hypothetical protein
VAVVSDETQALRDLGLLLCDRIRYGVGGPKASSGPEAVRLPRMANFIRMSRSEILEITGVVTLRSRNAWNVSETRRRVWSRVFGCVALSYARVGDLLTVAALVRAAAHLGQTGDWLDEAEMYILDQQQPNGSFGLLGSEFTLLQNAVTARHAVLRLTVEVLWALAETDGLCVSSALSRGGSGSDER